MIKLKPNQLPKELKKLHQPVKQLYSASVNLDNLMMKPRLGIVGSRKVTPYGRAVTTKLATELANKGVVVVSGLAIGVDSIAQSSVVKAGRQTIAVMPCGLSRIYPTGHTQLAKDIVEAGGELITEYDPDTPPLQYRFIERNRIIAALSNGLLITEAALKSGSLHTAKFALEMGVPVFAVPGPITSPLSEGTNNLIKMGATPVTSVDDILNELNWNFETKDQPNIVAASESERVILTLISGGLSEGSELQLSSRLTPADFNQTMTMLELSGKIRPLGANHWAIS